MRLAGMQYGRRSGGFDQIEIGTSPQWTSEDGAS
jgi:hypothetical protein